VTELIYRTRTATKQNKSLVNSFSMFYKCPWSRIQRQVHK